MNFTRLDASGSVERQGNNVLNALATIMSRVFIPSLQRLDKGWGTLDNTPQGAQVKAELINTLDSFVSVLIGKICNLPRCMCALVNTNGVPKRIKPDLSRYQHLGPVAAELLKI